MERDARSCQRTDTLTSVFIAAANDVWAVGMGSTIIHWDGVSWVAVTSPSTGFDLYSVFISARGAWMVGPSVLLSGTKAADNSKMVGNLAYRCLVRVPHGSVVACNESCVASSFRLQLKDGP